MKQASLIAAALLALIVLAFTVKNEPQDPGSEAQSVEGQAKSVTDASTSDATREASPRFLDSAEVERRFAIYRESFFELDRRVLLANQGTNLREHLTPMSSQEQSEYASRLVRCASYFGIRDRLNDGFDDPDLDMRFGILSSNLHGTSVSVASVAAGYSGANPLDLINTEKAAFRADFREQLAARDTPRFEAFKTAEEHRCLKLFDWVKVES